MGIGAIKYAKDSTLAMLLAAQARGFELAYLEMHDLLLRDGVALGRVRPLTVTADLDSKLQVYSVAGAVSGVFSLAAAVSYVTDASSARAMIGASPQNDSSLATSGSFTNLADLAAHEVGGGVVCPLLEHQVAEGAHEREATFGPARLVLALALGRRHVERRQRVEL